MNSYDKGYSQARRAQMEQDLDLEERFSPLNIREPKTSVFREIVVVTIIGFIAFMGIFATLDWFFK